VTKGYERIYRISQWAARVSNFEILGIARLAQDGVKDDTSQPPQPPQPLPQEAGARASVGSVPTPEPWPKPLRWRG